MSNTDGENNKQDEKFFNDLRLKIIMDRYKSVPSLKIQAIVFGACWFVLLVLLVIAMNIKNGAL